MNSQLIRRVFVIISVIVFLLSACATAGAPSKQSVENMALTERGARSASSPQLAMYDSSTDLKTEQGQGAERLVIKNASLSLVTDDPESAMDAITQLAKELGGFVVNASLSQQELESGAKVPRAEITIRVQAERLDEALQRIKALSQKEPLSENLDSQDVTKEYTDLKSRLLNEENTETTLQKIMDQAIRTEDVLTVYNQLVQVRERIEVLKGQIQYYEKSAELSSIRIELMANEAVQPLTIGGWQPVGVVKTAVQTLINSLKAIINLVIWIVIFVLPVLLVLFLIFGLPALLIMRFIRRRKPGKPETAPGTQALSAGDVISDQ